LVLPAWCFLLACIVCVKGWVTCAGTNILRVRTMSANRRNIA
jgi:hypothetical protein